MLFLGIHAQGAHALKFPPHRNISVHYMNFCPAGWRQKLHYLYFCLWVAAWAMVWRPQWIYASDPLACPAAWALSFFPWLRVLYHEHDAPAPAAGAFQRIVLLARRLVSAKGAPVYPPESGSPRSFPTRNRHETQPSLRVELPLHS